MDRRFVAVIPLDKLTDAALVAHGVEALFFGLVGRLDAFVADGNLQPRVQKRLLAHSRMQRLVVILRGVEHLGVGLEGDLRAVLVGRADNSHFLRDIAARELHLVDLAVAEDVDNEPLGKGIDNRRAHAVQSAGDLIASAAEFAARMQHRIDDLERRLSRLRLNVDRDAASVV